MFGWHQRRWRCIGSRLVTESDRPFELRGHACTCNWTLATLARIAVLVVVVAFGLLGNSRARAQPGDTTVAKAAAASFLGRYALPTGRIDRIDQGGDTVSAGQAYGMLMSAALGERQRFALIWRWTRTHLKRRDGLLASRWRGGRVIDANSASDADLDAARSLILAGERFHVGMYRRDGQAMAGAILAHETKRLGRSLVLLAGSWAREPATVDPGYWAPRTFELLTAATREHRFALLEQSAISLAGQLTANTPHLPPDWATMSATGVPQPIAGPPGPHREATPRYSLDAARLPIRFAEACDRASREIPAAMWPFFSAQPAGTMSFAYSLDGRPLAPQQNAVVLVGAAAAAEAAGQTAARDRLLAQADATNARFPTYFGSAWIALGRLVLETALLGSC
jgi:endo-1,4-beta-D-glucanase Y